MLYLLLKLIHVLAVVLFLGAGVVGYFLKAHADRSRDLRVIINTLESVVLLNRLFIIPSVLILALAGFGAAIIGNLSLLHTGWLFWSIVLFAFSGLADGLRTPLQLRMLEFARVSMVSGSFNWSEYQSRSIRWKVWSVAMLVAAVAATVLMVFKP